MNTGSASLRSRSLYLACAVNEFYNILPTHIGVKHLFIGVLLLYFVKSIFCYTFNLQN